MEQLYNVQEVAERLHRTEKTIKKYIGRGLTAYDLPGGYLFSESSVEDFLRKHKVPREY